MNSTLSIKPLSNEPLKTNSTNWQMEVLMEKLRSKACSLRSMHETAKLIKQSILNKQHILDPGEKAALGQCLDQLQQNIKVTSLPAMVERLESTARQLGLTFTSRSSAPEVYISCDMFYVEVHLQNEGKVKDVTVELAGDQNEPRSQSSPELVECLNQGNFADFMGHLEGFLSIYQLNTDKKTKCKAYQALQALEVDLLKLFEMSQETFGNDSQRLILKSPVGLLIKRKGGHPVRMIYFNSPYELLDVDLQRSISLTHETAATRDLEYHVSVTIEASTSRKLQAASLVNIMKGNDGLTLPSISGLSSANSVPLPACFTLRLKKPMALSLALANKISDVTGIPCYDISSKQSLLPLIIKQETISDFQMDSNNNKGLFVTLPDQQHCYFVANNDDFEGVLVHRVPFAHPTSVAPILDFLRVQAVFNSLITSCVRPESKQSMESAFIFEVTAVSHDYISVTFEHPQEESTATAELDLTDITNVKCKLYTLTNDPVLCSDEYATKVFQRCLSIPITMRAVMRKIVKEEKKVILPQGDSVVKMDSNNVQADPNQNTKFLFNDYGSLGIRRDHVMGPHSNNINNVMAKDSTCNQALFGGNNNDSNQTLISAIGGSTNSATSTLVGSFGSSLLPSVCQQKNQVQHHFLADGKMAKVRKRKSGLDSDHKSPRGSDDIVIEVNDKTADSLINEASLHMRRDIKFEKLPNILGKRRSSADGTGLSDTGSSELAALREKVYGAGSAASFAKLSYMHSGSKDTKDFSKKFKKQKSEGGAGNFKKSPIVLDLTDAESARKMGAVTGTTATSSSVSLSAALLKRPGIEIIPIPGSNTPISIPSSITVTPVIKSSDDKFKDKKDKKDRKDFDKKDKKRRREDSPNRGCGNSLLAKSSKIQIINTGMKHSTLSSLDSLKGDGKSLSGVTMKPSTPYHSPIKKPSLSPNISKTIIPPNKITYSPTHKPSKLHYNPSHLSVSSSVTTSTSPSMLTSSSNSSSSTSSSKGITSPKPSSSPKHSSVSPKHSSIGKPSMNTLKSNSPTFTKPSLSPKLNKNIKEKEKSSSPSRPLSSPVPFSSNSSTSPLSMKAKYSSATEKPKPVFSEALTITKVSSGETISSSSISLTSCSLSSAFSQTGTQNISAASLLEKLSVEKAKASPPKNRKGSSLSDIVDKLRAGVSGGSGDPQCKDKIPKVGPDGKKEGDNFTIKSSTGLKFTINKAKHKEGGSAKSNSAGYPSPNSTSQSSKNSSKSPSGLKPGVMSAPASKKVSMSSLPPIPKLPPASISNITATAISPLGNSLSMAHSSPLQYGRERQRDSKERDRDKERVPSLDKLKSKDTLSAFKGNSLAENKKESQDKNFIGKSIVHKEDKRSHHSGLSPKKKPVITDSVDRALKEFFGEDDNPAQDCPDNAIESLSSSEFLKQNISRKSSVVDRLEHKPKCDISKDADSNKDDSELMAPPLIPPTPLTKPLEKDALHCLPSSESLQKDNVPTISSHHPLPRSDSPINFPPASPLVSIKIVKSPAPVTSPLNMISPQSVSSQHSPCIIDDELMDEALMGSRK